MINSCVHFENCSGCDFLDYQYRDSLILKENYLKEIFLNDVKPIVASPKSIYYRHKLQLPFGTKKGKFENLLTLGLHSRDLSRIIDLKECQIQDESMTEISFIIRDYFRENNFTPFDEKKQDGLLKYLIIRKSFFSSEILICIVTSYNYTFKEQTVSEMVFRIQDYIEKKNIGLSLAGILQNINNRNTSMALGEKFKSLYGKTFIKEKVAGNFFHVGISTFLQVNPFISDKMYSYVKSKISQCERILDIYSGIGTLTLYLADKADKIYGIEINPESVTSANNAAKANQIKNVKFISGDATRSIHFIKDKIDLIVVDPPRIGLTKELIDSCFQLNPKRMIYISCDPQTLKRDLYYLENQYKIQEIQAFDMFPFTKHIETVVILDKL